MIFPLIVSLYISNAVSFALYNLLRQPELCKQIQDAEDRVFVNEDLEADALSKSEIDLAYRFFMESRRLYPIFPIQVRMAINSCLIES